MTWDGTERRMGLNHLKEIMDLKMAATEKALQVQAEEYARRLADLNHESEQLKDMQSTYVPRETYEYGHRELTNKIDSLAKLVYIGLGIIITLQFVLHFLK